MFALRASGENRGTMVAEIGRIERGVLVDLAGEEASAQRAEGDKADAEFFERGQQFRFGPAPEQRILALDRSDRMDGVGAPDRLYARFRQAVVLDLCRRPSGP